MQDRIARARYAALRRLRAVGLEYRRVRWCWLTLRAAQADQDAEQYRARRDGGRVETATFERCNAATNAALASLPAWLRPFAPHL